MSLFKKKLSETLTLDIPKEQRSGEKMTVRVVVKHTFDKSKKHVMFVSCDRNTDIHQAAESAAGYVRRATGDVMWHSGVSRVVDASEAST